ncbi:MAG: T9SS type A sorting domain-containing protein [Bacteroidales bacterium]|nr:T9SS type A sorting domain-containing protein [Bacteroidales bacterium]
MKKQKRNALILVLLGSVLIATNMFSQDPNFHIYLCFGQSNMEGQGTITTADKIVDSRFKVFQSLDCSNMSRTKATWYTAVPPLCQCYSNLSPADYFGRTMVANLPDSITVGVINVAIGGCDIRIFDKDIYTDYDSTYKDAWFADKVKMYNGNPYKHLMDLAKLAQKDGVIKGILLHQGETNTGDAKWPTYVKKIYNDMITELSLSATEVPLLAGQVVDAAYNGCCSSMNTIINRLPDTLANSYVISSKGCPDLADNAHFNAEGYRTLGRRYAVTMLNTMGKEAVYAEAECGTVGENMMISADKLASNASYVTNLPNQTNTTQAPTTQSNSIEMSFTLASDTTYYLYGRFNNPSATADSYWIKVDNEAYELSDNLSTTGWQWLALGSHNLSKGVHKISFAMNEVGTMLDKLVLKNTQIIPVSIGEEAAVVFAPEITLVNLEEVTDLPGYSLQQNIPNPLTGKTNISFEIPVKTYVSLKIFNIKGVELIEPAGKEFEAGKHTIACDLDSLQEGTYYYTLKTDKYTATKSMTVKK